MATREITITTDCLTKADITKAQKRLADQAIEAALDEVNFSSAIQRMVNKLGKDVLKEAEPEIRKALKARMLECVSEVGINFYD